MNSGCVFAGNGPFETKPAVICKRRKCSSPMEQWVWHVMLDGATPQRGSGSPLSKKANRLTVHTRPWSSPKCFAADNVTGVSLYGQAGSSICGCELVPAVNENVGSCNDEGLV